jgi:hypothetical protein
MKARARRELPAGGKEAGMAESLVNPEIRIERAPWYHGAHVLIRSGDSVVSGVELETPDPGRIASPSFSISDENAQTLMDDLWAAGFRPTEGSGSAGSLRATEKHLDDMRRIVGKHLMVNLK